MPFDSATPFDLVNQPFDAGPWPSAGRNPALTLPGVPIPQKGTYLTRSEDAWDLISYKIFNTEAYRSELIDANPEYANVMIFDSGIELVIPQITTAQSMTLPPWLSGINLTP